MNTSEQSAEIFAGIEFQKYKNEWGSFGLPENEVGSEYEVAAHHCEKQSNLRTVRTGCQKNINLPVLSKNICCTNIDGFVLDNDGKLFFFHSNVVLLI